MLYVSTRGSLNKKTGAQAVIQGIAEDKGLYVPASIPKLPFKGEDMLDASSKEIAKKILRCYFGDFAGEEVEECVNGAVD